MSDTPTELYRKYRPKLLTGVVGQDAAVKFLLGKVKKKAIPHAILFTGPSGVGKTALALSLAEMLKVSEWDMRHYNSADFRGVDTVRDIRNECGLNGFGGTNRVYLLDEIHQMTPDAQEAALVLLENPPRRAYFFLTTTRPDKLKDTFKSRCTLLQLESLTPQVLRKLMKSVVKAEGERITTAVLDKLCERAGGSARTALTELEKVLGLETEKERLAFVSSPAEEEHAVNIASMLVKGVPFKQVAEAIRSKPDMDIEKVRWGVLGYATAILLNGKADPNLINLIDAFRDPWYDCKMAGLVAACWEVLEGHRK